MSRRDSQERASFSPTQRKACFVLAGCVVAVILSFVAAWILPNFLFGGSGDYDPNAYPLDTSLGAILTESSDAGNDYLSSTVFVGDQLFTDIYGAKRAGIPNILVRPIHPKEEIQIVLKRYLEKIVLHFYGKDQKKS